MLLLRLFQLIDGSVDGDHNTTNVTPIELDLGNHFLLIHTQCFITLLTLTHKSTFLSDLLLILLITSYPQLN